MEIKRKEKLKELGMDILIDIVGGILIAIGVYNFALKAEFPMTGFSGLAIIVYHLLGFPIGVTTMVLNIPVALICYRILGRDFFIRSIKTIVITSVIMDVIAPMFPVYEGDRMLAAICTGVFSGLGYALIYMRNSSTGGSDFIIMSIKALKPHLTLGKISFGLEVIIILMGSLLFRDVDGLIYGMLINYLLSAVIDKVMYGIDSGKLTLIVTRHGQEVADMIDELSGRGSTLLKGVGSYSKEEKQVVMCACNNKQMYTIKKLAKRIDPTSFTVIMESNEVVGEGFKED